MATTYTLISSVTVGSGGAANIEFTSIPATYTDLVLKWSGRASQSSSNWDGTALQFNNNTGSIYNNRQIYGTGSSVASGSGTGANAGYASTALNTSNTFSNAELYIPNYTSSNDKSFSVDSVTENNGTAALASFTASLATLSGAITSIKIISDTTFLQYTTAYLYGISNA